MMSQAEQWELFLENGKAARSVAQLGRLLALRQSRSRDTQGLGLPWNDLRFKPPPDMAVTLAAMHAQRNGHEHYAPPFPPPASLRVRIAQCHSHAHAASPPAGPAPLPPPCMQVHTAHR